MQAFVTILGATVLTMGGVFLVVQLIERVVAPRVMHDQHDGLQKRSSGERRDRRDPVLAGHR